MVPTDSKAVLFCPDCGNESPPDGDWMVVEERADGRSRHVYGCPDCGRVIESRRLFDPVPA